MTPDSNFILDYHPRHKNIVIGAGFSGNSDFNTTSQFYVQLPKVLFECAGHGFKLGPVVGDILAALALNKAAPFDLSRFAVKRFD